MIDDVAIEVIQFPFNVLDNWSLRGELIQKAKDRNKIIHTRSVFLQGLFFMDRKSNHNIVKALKSELALIDILAQKYNFTMTELAMNYCLQQHEIDNVLIGVDSLAQLQNNLNLIKNIDSEIIDAINNIKVTNTDFLNPGLWK